MHLRYITYFTWLDEELVMVPNFPAWVCDLCGRREYDEKSISWLTMLLDPNAGRPTRRKPVRPRRAPRPASRPSARPKPTR
jgi:YgiT-type zinc finger domain-containing protein